jgi:hypothetical protein
MVETVQDILFNVFPFDSKAFVRDNEIRLTISH